MCFHFFPSAEVLGLSKSQFVSSRNVEIDFLDEQDTRSK